VLCGECHALIAVPILLLACIGLVLRRSLLVAVASNPSFVYAFFLAYARLVTETPVLEASLAADVYRPAFAFFSGSGSIGAGMLLVSSLLSFTTSHIVYVPTVRSA
jgi:hypothetical protein